MTRIATWDHNGSDGYLVSVRVQFHGNDQTDSAVAIVVQKSHVTSIFFHENDNIFVPTGNTSSQNLKAEGVY